MRIVIWRPFSKVKCLISKNLLIEQLLDEVFLICLRIIDDNVEVRVFEGELPEGEADDSYRDF